MRNQFLSHTPISCTIITLLAFLLILPSAFAATIIVNDIGDASDANPGDGIAATSLGVATLRAALEEANALSGEDTITFDTSLFASPQTILISQKLSITENIVIVGPGAENATLDAQSSCQILCIVGSIAANISGLTLTKGYASQYEEYFGGAVNISSGVLLNISDCILSNNEGYYGGGAIYADLGDISIRRCQVIENTATTSLYLGGGGGLLAFSSSVTLENCLVESNNCKTDDGGGINVEGDLILIDCIIKKNSGTNGAGI